MVTAQQSRFSCPNCGAPYEIVRVEADVVLPDREITCLGCGAPLQGREGGFALKYFLLGPSALG
jgi:ribosomal protein S27E